MYTVYRMQINSDILPKGRKYDLFREMQRRSKKEGKEAFTAYSLRFASNEFMRNPANLRKDLEALEHEGLVHKDKKLKPIVAYKPDGPSGFIQAGGIRENFKARVNDLINFRLLAGDNTYFECQRCGRFFAGARVCLVPLVPVRRCPYCRSNSKFGLSLRIRTRMIQ